jgi:hypothetical protein
MHRFLPPSQVAWNDYSMSFVCFYLKKKKKIQIFRELSEVCTLFKSLKAVGYIQNREDFIARI